MKLLYLALISSVFIGSFVLGFGYRAKEVGIKAYDIGQISALPVLTKNSSFPILSGQGVVAVDPDSGVVLYEKDASRQLFPASTTKILTALVSLEYYKLDQVLTVEDISVEGQKMGLGVGEQITFDNLLNALLIYSANDAAVALADNYPGGRDSFVNAMNNKARELHLDHSHFANPAGLDDSTQLTTASDMVRLAQVAMKNPYFAKIVGTKRKVVTNVDGRKIYDLTNLNQLLGKIDGVMGVKTGWTQEARENLVTYVNRKDHKVFIAILGSQDRFGETIELVDWIYKSYTWQTVPFYQKLVGSLF